MALEDVRVDLPLWNMTLKQMLAADSRDDGVETVCENRNRMMEEYDRRGSQMRDVDHGALCVRSNCDSRVRLSMSKSGMCCSVPNRATWSEGAMTCTNTKDKKSLQLHR